MCVEIRGVTSLGKDRCRYKMSGEGRWWRLELERCD